MDRDDGFTLIELLVVILIIAILAAIAIPVFLRQREKGWQSQQQAALKNAATTLETVATENGGSYIKADQADSANNDPNDPTDPYTILVANGYKKASAVEIQVEVSSDGNNYCITAVHQIMPTTNVWQTATWASDQGSPIANADGDCNQAPFNT